MVKKDKDAGQRQAQWEKENAEIQQYRQLGPQIKAALRAKGCVLPYYDMIDSPREEFKSSLRGQRPNSGPCTVFTKSISPSSGRGIKRV